MSGMIPNGELSGYFNNVRLQKNKGGLGDNNIELSVTWHFESVLKKLVRILLMLL